MSPDADVIIIGAGVAGLTCGCLLAKKGLKVLIVEKNQKVGGCCASFEKDGFFFDLSVQSIGECQRGGRVWNLLDTLDLLNQIYFIPLEPAREYHFPNFTMLQSSRLETHIENLSRRFPKEGLGIEQIYKILGRIFDEFSRMPVSLSLADLTAFSSNYPLLFHYKDRTYQELLDEWVSDPFLKTLLSIRSSYGLLPPEEISVTGMAGIEMSYFLNGVSCIRGRVETLPLEMGETLQAMGGQIFLSREVDRIRVEEKKAIGVGLKNGQELTAKVVISNIDAYTTFLNLIEEDSLPNRFRAKLSALRPSLSYFILYLGVEGGLDDLSTSNHEVFFNDHPYEEYHSIYKNEVPEETPFYLLAPSKINPSHAPKGKSTLCLSYKVPYSLSPDWDHGNQGIRDQLSRRLIQRASVYVPHLEDRILVRTETTPKAIEQWTGNRYGAAYGWAQTPPQSGMYRLQRTTPIPNLFLTGHWTSPGGGISGVVASGELTASVVLNKFEHGAY
jgi:phytoene desaturase